MENIRAIIIIEIMGYPIEHVSESLKNHIAGLGKLDGVEIFSESYSKPKKIEEAKAELYTCFAEVELETESFSKMIDVIFGFMPSSIEILSPENITFNVSGATDFFNNLTGRLHRYDEVAKIAQIKNRQLAVKLVELEKKNKESKEEN